MKLATFEASGRVTYGVVRDDGVVDVGVRLGEQFPSLQALLSAGEMGRAKKLEGTASADYALKDVRILKPILRPGKILCVGVNYPERNAEYKDDSTQPKYPSIFVRFPASLVAHEESLLRPLESQQLDYEGEVALVIGRKCRRLAEAEAWGAIAGYMIGNDGTIRDWVRHGKFNVTPGKNFDRSGSIGPWLVTRDEIESGSMRIVTRVNGEIRQDDTTDRMIFSIPALLSYISTFCTLEPGDILFTGTPAGAGARFDPPRFLVPGDVVEVEVSGIGTLRNRVADESSSPK
jgi:2-keto-4-pentenoate hydratase/2-oxohepta-3-ene-1,7-dioic acid hydratase in catechol pathway